MGMINVTGLGKAYKQYPNRWSRLLEWMDPRSKNHHQLRWVIKNVNFVLKSGEALAIIGLNGAGKSTLLKMITGTTRPTEGAIRTVGSIAPLLELGIGFHPDFTGRQNVYLAGQLLGYSRDDVDRLMPEIEAFSEIGDYIDKPVRIYSSGMQVRLAFSLATARRPDILIVDEALSVGDAYFQHKCFDRIRSMSAQGTSLLFVSHDPGAIRNLCRRALLLNRGTVEFEGSPDEVLDYYNAMLASTELKRLTKPDAATGSGMRSGTQEVMIESLRLLQDGKVTRVFTAGGNMSIEVNLRCKATIGEFTLGLSIRDMFGNAILGTNTEMLQKNLHATREGSRIRAHFTIADLGIGAGSYSISLAAHDPRSHVVSNYDWWDKAAIFEIYQSPNDVVAGLCRLSISFESTLIEEP
jgi:lipopolysaccharide transport system ATP-binding protein